MMTFERAYLVCFIMIFLSSSISPELKAESYLGQKCFNSNAKFIFGGKKARRNKLVALECSQSSGYF